MVKKFQLAPVIGIEGFPIKIPQMQDGAPVTGEDGNVVFKDANLADILDVLVRGWPVREAPLTLENITHATRMKSQMLESAKNGSDVLVLEEAEHDWIKKVLRDDKIGPKIYGMNTLKVIDALDDFARLHQPKEKE